RAAELADYGMVGVGQIFEAFRSGQLEDDDEVAVAHAQAEHEYLPASDAMVNIRATLAAAEARSVVSSATRGTLETIAKSLFYGDRAYKHIARQALERGAPPREIEALLEWLPGGRLDIKRDDAVEMLRIMRPLAQGERAAKAVNYRFEHTHTWQALQ